MKLTDKLIKSLPTTGRTYKKTDGQNLYLEVSPTGRKYWRLKYRYLGIEKRLALGVYPEVSLVEARDKRHDARKLLAAGIDPGRARKEHQEQTLANAQNTFEAVGRAWHAHRSPGWSESHQKDILSRLEREVFPIIGAVPIKDITAGRVLQMVRRIEARGALEVARRCLQYSIRIFSHAIGMDLIPHNPAVSLTEMLTPIKRGSYAALKPADIPEFLATLRENRARLFIHTILAIELIMLTFVRTSELIEMKWDEIDLDQKVWEIPAERMKMRQRHKVPLSTDALAILKKLKEINGHRPYVFAGRKDPNSHMSNNTILRALKLLGYGGRMTGHGFRALAMSTIMERLGYRYEVPNLQLAHLRGDQLRQAYDRTDFWPERVKMMQDWADYLRKVAAVTKSPSLSSVTQPRLKIVGL